MRRTLPSLVTAVAISIAAAGCASEVPPESTWSLEADPDTVVLEFQGDVDVTTGEMHLRFLDPVDQAAFEGVGGSRAALTEVTVISDGMPGSGPVDTAELVTTASGVRANGSVECGTVPGGSANCFYGDVDLRHFYATRHLSNAYAQIVTVTAGYEGYGGATATTLGLDASKGLYRYGTLEPATGSFTYSYGTRRWRFRLPVVQNFSFTGKVFATLQTPSAINAPFIASLDEQGRKGAGDSRVGCVTDDGRYTVFSTALPLISTDTNGRSDIYRRDTLTGNLVLVSLRNTGALTTLGDATTPCMSADANIVVFASTASDMIATTDTNAASDIFARNISAATTTGASTTTSGTTPLFCGAAVPSGVGAFRPSISADGRYVAFDSTCGRLCGQTTATPSAANIAAGCMGGRPQVYRKDRTLGTTTGVSIVQGSTNYGGAGLNDATRRISLRPSISNDGNRIVFDSTAGGTGTLVVGDTTVRDVFLRVITPASTTRISVDSIEANSPRISAGGTTIVFASSGAQGLVDGSTGSDIFRFVITGAITGGLSTPGTLSIISVNGAGAQVAGAISSAPWVSSDGCRTVFRSSGALAGGGGTNGIFLRNACTSTTALVSRNGEGVAAGASSDFPMISPNGAWSMYETTSTFLSIDGATVFDTANTDVYFVRN